jgi:hypothetical protein
VPTVGSVSAFTQATWQSIKTPKHIARTNKRLFRFIESPLSMRFSVMNDKSTGAKGQKVFAATVCSSL